MDDILRAVVEKGNPDFYPNPVEVKEKELLGHFKQRQEALEYFESKEYKEDEEIRRTSAKPKEHTTVDFSRVYCPIYDTIRPEWLCANEHGDYHYSNFDMEPKE